MIYVLAEFDNGYCTCSEEETVVFPDGTPTSVIEDAVANWANVLADDYINGCVVDEEDEDEVADYYDNISFDYRIISYEEYLSFMG